MLSDRPDVPLHITETLRQLVAAHGEGRLKGMGVVALVMSEQPTVDGNAVLIPISQFGAGNKMLRSLVTDEMEQLVSDVRAESRLLREQQMMAEQRARHAAEDAKARSTILAADGKPINGAH